MKVSIEQLEAAAKFAESRGGSITMSQMTGETDLRVAADTVIQWDGAIFLERLRPSGSAGPRFQRIPVLL